ncbi:MAG TPA: hypothetical protein VGR70_15350 [Stellaceae bacterium]|nr:hypothetical protein [Stellaceae bacterium]
MRNGRRCCASSWRRFTPDSAEAALPSPFILKTLGHASIALYRDGDAPLLLTDPWLIGSVYWRSWWLQNYPAEAELDWLARAENIYVTHEHPDHFHTPSIRRLGKLPLYLFPALPETGFVDYLRKQGYRTEVMPPATWRSLGSGVSILSLPLWNDDSLLLLDTPEALILNFNDAKPPTPVVSAVRRLADRIGKPRILLASYSPASLVNSFRDAAGEIVSIKAPEGYVGFVCRLCERLGADVYLPFASQASFERADSEWANRYRTSYADLEHLWQGRTQLLPPYTTLALADLSHQWTPPDAYRAAAAVRRAARTEGRIAEERAAAIDASDAARLRRKLNLWRWLLWPLFPRGFAFEAGGKALVYDPRRGRVRIEPAGDYGDFVVTVPTLTLKEALAHDHLSDLGITMFVRIRLLRQVDPRKVYGLFVLFQFDDYGHMRGPAALLRWLACGLRRSLPRILPLPP